eukprot:3911987-Lingulodinium_polyedra.AAC.1
MMTMMTMMTMPFLRKSTKWNPRVLDKAVAPLPGSSSLAPSLSLLASQRPHGEPERTAPIP